MIIAHDIHTHNVLSNCCPSRTAHTEAMVQREIELGNRIYGLSNHIWDERVKGASPWYTTQSISKAEESKPVLKNAPSKLRCLFGAESEYCHCHDLLGMSEEGAKHFDYLLFPHTHQQMRNYVIWEIPEAREMRKQIEADLRQACPYLSDDAVRSMMSGLGESELLKYTPEIKTDLGVYFVQAAINSFRAMMENQTFINICSVVPTSVAHPFSMAESQIKKRNDMLKSIDDETFRDCFSMAKRIGAYIEFNVGAVKYTCPDLCQNEMIRMFRIAKSVGCQFTFGTDSHTVEGLELIRFGTDICNYLHLKRTDLADHIQDGIIE